MSRQISEEDKQEIIKVLKVCANMHEAARKVNLPFSTFKYRVKTMGLYNPTPHAPRTAIRRDVISLREIIYENKHPHYGSSKLKQRLFKEGLKTEKCEKCGQGNNWNGKPLKLQLDHIDGDSSNNHISNLQILCPNCHTQTETWGAKQRKKTVSDVEILEALAQNPHPTKVMGLLKMSKSKQNLQRVRELKNKPS